MKMIYDPLSPRMIPLAIGHVLFFQFFLNIIFLCFFFLIWIENSIKIFIEKREQQEMK
jgi:hypothetical protein